MASETKSSNFIQLNIQLIGITAFAISPCVDLYAVGADAMRGEDLFFIRVHEQAEQYTLALETVFHFDQPFLL